jgi:hypothetical protein
VHPNQTPDWQKRLQERLAEVFEMGKTSTEPAGEVKILHAKIGQLTLENDFFGRCARQAGIAESKAMIDRDHALPVTWRCWIQKKLS